MKRLGKDRGHDGPLQGAMQGPYSRHDYETPAVYGYSFELFGVLVGVLLDGVR